MLADTPVDKWRRAFDVEVHGLFTAVQAILPHWRAQGGGSVVHLGSAGHRRWPDKDGMSVAPKAANESFIKGIAREEGRYGIRANSVLVGVIDAGMFHKAGSTKPRKCWHCAGGASPKKLAMPCRIWPRTARLM
jgi:NAD(P)-dependent dehydrogenase (short-subunit alcohol dehydrogenase family)